MTKTKPKTRQFTPAGLDRMKVKETRFERSEPSGLRVVIGQRSKSFFYRYKSPATGKHRNLHLGHYPAVSLSEARDKVTAAKEMLLNKIDPWNEVLEARLHLSDSPTLAEVIQDYLTKIASTKKSEKDIRRYLEKEISSKLGGLKIGAVQRQQVVAIIDEVAQRAPTAAGHLLIYTKAVFSFAEERCLIDRNPCIGIKKPAKSKSRQRALTIEEIQIFWQNVQKLKTSQQIKDVLCFSLITAQRSGEIRNMKWEDLSDGWWTIPPDISKNGLSHRVPLTKMAMEIVNRAKSRNDDGPYVFSGKYSDKPLAVASPSQAIREGANIMKIADFKPHDLRRTAGSHMTSIGIPRFILARILNHAETGITAVYDRHSYDAEKKQALQKWDTNLETILGKNEDMEEPDNQTTGLTDRIETDPLLVEAQETLNECRVKYQQPPHDGRYLLFAMEQCQMLGIPIPEWAYKPFYRACLRWHSGVNKTLDEGLNLSPQPYRKLHNMHVRLRMYMVCCDLQKAGVKQPKLFTEAANILSAKYDIHFSHETVRKTYQEHKRELEPKSKDTVYDQSAIIDMLAKRRKKSAAD